MICFTGCQVVPYVVTTPLYLLGAREDVIFTDPVFPFDWYIGRTMLTLSVITYVSIAFERYILLVVIQKMSRATLGITLLYVAVFEFV